MSQPSARPTRIVDSTAIRLSTGSEPGQAEAGRADLAVGRRAELVAQPQNIFDAVPSSTCTSSPSTGSNWPTASS